MGYWLRGNEGEGNNCFSQIQQVGQKNIETKQQNKLKLAESFFTAKTFSLLVGYNIYPISSSTNQNAALMIDHKLDFTKLNDSDLSHRKCYPPLKQLRDW